MILNSFSKSYGGRTVLDFGGAELPDGKICAVIGSNGSGKSTLAGVLCGTVPPDGGGKALADDISVGFMPQKSFAFRMSTLSNVCIGGGDKDSAMELLRRLGIDGLAKNRAKRLSGGETARMALARMLMNSRQLLILDEPTASMDMESTAMTEALVRDYCQSRGCTVLWITHSLQQARRVADHVLFMHKGRLWESGEAKKLLYEPEKAETRQFLEFYGL